MEGGFENPAPPFLPINISNHIAEIDAEAMQNKNRDLAKEFGLGKHGDKSLLSEESHKLLIGKLEKSLNKKSV